LKEKITNKTLKRYLLVILPAVAVLCSFYPMMEANATHLYTGLRWPTTSAPWCADNSLGHLNIGLGNSANAISTASSYINGFSSKWFLPRINNDGTCHNHVYAASLGLDKLARTDYNYQNNRFTIMNTVINQNYHYTTSGCTNGQEPVRLSYLMKHEFTHWLQMKHDTQKIDATYSHYGCTLWNHWSSHSQGTAKAVYG